MVSPALIRWLAGTVPQLVQLAMLPFDRMVHETFCARIGWDVFREDWYPETCFEVHFDDVERRLIAVYETSESTVGIGLYAVGEPQGLDDYYLRTLPEYDAAFHDALAQIKPHVPWPPTVGAYDQAGSIHRFKFAFWAYAETFMTLVQHFEGDGHAGHECSLDIRIVPRTGAAELTFPLKTNVLF